MKIMVVVLVLGLVVLMGKITFVFYELKKMNYDFSNMRWHDSIENTGHSRTTKIGIPIK